ncbi:49f2a253-7626-47e7-8305-42f1e1033ed5 [Sclerotinia trifoliorum]|uniref:49f2a253-7626-47e7-8305-42f1e1033ed5 n=1 Tax=Sclerotinia trifoliorum TaxID=28548 RepID=A0A8H2VWL7_9HELO|nr:49f2a253-7626-47e7-8305-42f1e1033ed5 [Sclerotinia trifoliorum]
MAPPRVIHHDTSIVHTPEYEDFIAKLRVYHEKRGTHFDPEPRVGTKTIDLLHLYNTVIERGGYDKVSDEKLAWRKLGSDFNLGANNLPALAFSLKTTYYKYLAAYEISTFHGKVPPPREILEDTTAKGGGLLFRTMDNFRPSIRRETGMLGTENSEASGDDGTPVRDRNGSEEMPGSGGRVTRGLRQAPPQRVLFQPDTQPSRQVRQHPSATSHPPPTPQHHLPQHQTPSHSHQHHMPRVGGPYSHNPSSGTESMSLAVASYEPRLQMPLTLRPIITPGNNAVEFARRQKALKDAAVAAAAEGTKSNAIPRGMMLPGTGFDGPNIYVRCLCSLRSGIKEEQDYALHHLVKISMERGDKYKFEGFPGLAEALIEKMLEIGSLFYDVHWRISYTEDGGMVSTTDTINGLEGTPDILERIKRLAKLPVDDNIQTEEFSDSLLQINEAALTMRNMVMLEENAFYVSELAPLRDFLSIALNLPNSDAVVELKHYALDIAEQLTKYLHFEVGDPLYLSLLKQLDSQDRGAILTSLRAISRISMNLEENNLLKGVPASAVQNIIDWTLLNDEDLAHACLDFLYQYTAVVENVDYLITEVKAEPLVKQLTRLLMHGARIIEKEFNLGTQYRKPAPSEIAPIPQDLLLEISKFEEPERSSRWLRCLYEEDPDESITQIALWHAYQQQFSYLATATSKALLPAADFIKNVSTTFGDKANAQVQNGPVTKFIIKGIRCRSEPVDLQGEAYTKCLWRTHLGRPCGEFFMTPEAGYQHILRNHFGAQLNAENKYVNSATNQQYVCAWDTCSRFRSSPATKLSEVATHIKVHLPPKRTLTSERESQEPSGPPPAKKHKPSYIVQPPRISFKYHYTAVDEHNDAAGIPLSSVLVLRNLARNVSKTEAEETALKEGEVSWVDRLFKPVEPRLFAIYAHNKILATYMTDLLVAIKDTQN